MSSEIKHGERAYVTYTFYVDCEFSEKIDDGACTGWEGEEEDEGSEEDG
jgi:hypothetical protein